MLARRITWLSTASKVFGYTNRHSPFQALLPIRRLNSHSPAGPSADIQRAIAEEARLLQRQDKSIPWYRLTAKYRISIDVLQNIFNQAEIEARRRQQQSELVTRATERRFERALGQCSWEAVASELDIPLIECLDLFDTSNSTIKSRSLIETYDGWSKMDMEKLKQFIAANYADGSTVSWKLVGAYMNIDALECQRVGQGTFKGPINGVGYRRICEFRDSGLDWRDIHQSELVDIIQRELPTRPSSDIRLFFDRYAYELKTGRMRASKISRLRELVAEYGEDWDRIGEALGVLPSRAQCNWIKFGRILGGRSAWTVDETREFQQLVDSGVMAKEAAKLLGTRSYWACQYKKACNNTLVQQQGDGVCSRLPWATADDEAQLRMVDGSIMSGAAKWEQASMATGHTSAACKKRFIRLNRKRKQVTDSREILVTSEVQRQAESSGAVDWLQVSQATGLGLRECLELSEHDVGKVGWHYDPDSFSQGMADRMTGFIEEHYPAPTPVSYRAVSNFMWVVMEDCIRIHGMLQGKFRWTEAEYERGTALRAQGLTYREIARHLSPTLRHDNVCIALKRYLSPRPVLEPISAGKLDEISRLVDEYAGKYPVAEIIAKIRTQLNLGNEFACHTLISIRIAAHPHYQAKLRDIDYNDLANRIAMGQTTRKLAAEELDIPICAMTVRMRTVDNKLYSSKWTEEEIRKLVDYVQGCGSKPDIAYFSKLLGTKSSAQCSEKIENLRRKGILPRLTKPR
ncbi:hypothetical protein GGH93_003664 [Coemansia aciculifera]|nr:hypothetical protein GGH93_003664 [Coemansia aciculifera]